MSETDLESIASSTHSVLLLKQISEMIILYPNDVDQKELKELWNSLIIFLEISVQDVSWGKVKELFKQKDFENFNFPKYAYFIIGFGFDFLGKSFDIAVQKDISSIMEKSSNLLSKELNQVSSRIHEISLTPTHFGNPP